MANNNPTRVVTGEARLSYVNLFTPRAREVGEDPKFSVTVLVPKSDVATKQRIDAAINAAIQRGVNEEWNGVRPPVLPTPVHDGDGVRPSDGMPFAPECNGHWVFTANCKESRPPQIVDAGLNPVINQSEIYSGVFGRVSVDFYPYNYKGKKGIGCGLGNVQKLRDGEPLAGGASAEDDFGAPQQPAQQSYTAPQQPAQAYGQYQQPAYGAPAYQQPAAPAYQPPTAPAQAYGQYQQPAYGQHAAPTQPQQPQIDPITGQPIGGVMGIG